MIGLYVRREFPRCKILLERLDRLGHYLGYIGVLAHELGGLTREADQVVEDQDLTIAVRAGTDADRGHGNFGGDHGRDFAWHALKDDSERACAFESDGIAPSFFHGG